ncbi:MAG TPA: transaldolase family protein, partial [Candidatus Babeliales bacterium]|nr:transaldolase family protein [Candidatus Babeliales bacterium]
MKIFLDTANIAHIKQWSETGIVDGVTTNPTHLSKEGNDPKKQVLEICSILPEGEISVEVTEKDPQAVYKQAKAIAALHKNILVKVPCHIDYYSVIDKLVKEDVRLNITLVFTLIQGMMMSKLGVDYISPFVGRWDDIDVDGIELVEQLKGMTEEYGYETQVLAASIRGVRHVHDSIMAGADAITIPIEILKKSVNHILTNQGIATFNADWQKLGIKQF